MRRVIPALRALRNARGGPTAQPMVSAQNPPSSSRRGLFARNRRHSPANPPETGESGGEGPASANNLGPLKMVWQAALGYPGKLSLAALALCITAAATLAIPSGFRLIIDRGFGSGGDTPDIGRWFQYLLGIVAVLAIGTALRFYVVSWLGERGVADIRLKVQANLLRLAPALAAQVGAPGARPPAGGPGV